MTRRPPRSTLSSSSAASDVYKRQGGALRRQAAHHGSRHGHRSRPTDRKVDRERAACAGRADYGDIAAEQADEFPADGQAEPTRLLSISYAVFCLKKKKRKIKTQFHSSLNSQEHEPNQDRTQ